MGTNYVEPTHGAKVRIGNDTKSGSMQGTRGTATPITAGHKGVYTTGPVVVRGHRAA